MAGGDILSRVKTALRRTDDTFDAEIEDLIQAALLDLGVAGVTCPSTDETDDLEQEQGTRASQRGALAHEMDTDNPLIRRAVITYCKAHFGDAEPQEYDRLKAAYDEQKAQLSMATGYTDWGGTA